MTEPNIEKLPKWAQEHIQQLTRERDQAQANLKRLLDSRTPSKIFTGMRMMDDLNYIQSDRVTFLLDGGEIQVSVEGNAIHCMANYKTARELVIKPCVTNVVDLVLSDREV